MKTTPFLLLSALACFMQLSNAQWSTSPAINTQVCVLPDSQNAPRIISDNSGGAFVIWKDKRFPQYNLYVQKLNSSGVPQWSSSGLMVQITNGVYGHDIIPDGSGGIIVVFNAGGAVVKINSAGVKQLTVDNGSFTGNEQAITPDGAGGVIIITSRYSIYGGSSIDLWAARVNSAGTVLWPTGGAEICSAPGTQFNSQVISDGSGGAIIAWEDQRVSPSNTDIYIQKVNSSGVVQWTANGVAVCTAANNQNSFKMVSDGSGGAIVCWTDSRSGTATVYAQKINSSGVVQWAADGVKPYTASGAQSVPQITGDGSGGAIICWQDTRSFYSYDIYAQRINSAGSVLWNIAGEPICVLAENQLMAQIIEDGSGGAIITWKDIRGNILPDIYTQKINSSGIVQWTMNGTPVCNEPRIQDLPVMTTDAFGGAIIAWTDFRNGTVLSSDIYCQRIQSDGSLPVSLVYFNWETEANTVALRWGTFEELNNLGFYIERKESAAGEWKQAGFVNGHGTTTEPQDYRFDDGRLLTGRYQYRLKQTDFNGNFEYFNLEELAVVGVPSAAKLTQNYPNPFNPLTKFDYHLPFDANVKIKIYNTAGIEVLSLADDIKKAGYYHMEFDGTSLASGIYFYRIVAVGLEQKFTETKKMILIK